MNKKCLITGIAGFIASNLTEKLLELNYNILGIDDLSTGKLENIPNNCNFEKISILEIEKLDNIFKSYKPNIVFHLAALPRVQFSIKNPELTHNTNINGTFNLLLKSKEYNVDRFIYSSSSCHFLPYYIDTIFLKIHKKLAFINLSILLLLGS